MGGSNWCIHRIAQIYNNKLDQPLTLRLIINSAVTSAQLDILFFETVFIVNSKIVNYQVIGLNYSDRLFTKVTAASKRRTSCKNLSTTKPPSV